MSWLDKLRGKKQEEPTPQVSALPKSQPQPPAKTFKVWDSYGRIMEISSEDWRTKVLPGTIQAQWDNPDALYDVIASALKDGFFQECLAPCQRLCAIDTKPPRGANIMGVVLLQLSRFAEAEKVFQDANRRYGENGYLLSNLAKAYGGQGKTDLVEGTLWHSLEVDPNQENGLLWWAAIHRERAGASGWEQSLQKAAGVRGSWRPQIWLGRVALERKDLAAALEFYRLVIQHCQPLPADALMQISGDLGNHGHLREIVELCAPQFDPKQHGLQPGNNLLKTYVDLKDAPAARRVLEQLYAQQRPDWKEHLLFWEKEIDKLDRGYGPVPATEKLQISMVVLEDPIWARSGSIFAELLPAKAADSLRVGFMCGSAEMSPSPHGTQMVTQPADTPGRLSRGLPLFLAEQVILQTDARAVFYAPWLKRGGFVLAGLPWTIDHLHSLEHNPDYVIFFHLIAKQVPWQAQFQLMRFIDQKILSEWNCEMDPNNSAGVIQNILAKTLAQLRSDAEIIIKQNHRILPPPEGAWLPHYLVGLEQALAVSCAALAPDTHPFLYAERSILDHLLEIALQQPANIPARFLLLSTVQREARARPDIAKEYRERLERLLREHPLVPQAQTLAQTALAKIFVED